MQMVYKIIKKGFLPRIFNEKMRMMRILLRSLSFGIVNSGHRYGAKSMWNYKAEYGQF
jgi:hypothetical protein